MITVSVEVRRGMSRFRAAVWAESIERALSLVGMRYPGCEVEVLFPIEPEGFFAKRPISTSRIVVHEVPEELAG